MTVELVVELILRLRSRVTRPHGNSGVVKSKFSSNLPPRAFGAGVRIVRPNPSLLAFTDLNASNLDAVPFEHLNRLPDMSLPNFPLLLAYVGSLDPAYETACIHVHDIKNVQKHPQMSWSSECESYIDTTVRKRPSQNLPGPSQCGDPSLFRYMHCEAYSDRSRYFSSSNHE